jgi:hypothetical protein
MSSNDRFTGLNVESTGIPANYQRGQRSGLNTLNGLYLARVVETADPDYNGNLYVELIGHERVSGREESSERVRHHKVRRTSPFGGTIQGSNYSNNFGSNFPPPPPGTEILVGFTGREQEGFVVGILGDNNRNATIPGLPASRLSESDEGSVGSSLESSPLQNQENGERVRHPVANAQAVQGIGLDAIRGPGSSGARRESPSNVAGFLTPGGHSITMDDGTVAYQEGVNHVPDRNREAGKNNLIRIRSGSGAQFLINDSAGIVYLINQNGSSWIQMDSAGNVDIYAQGSVSMHAEEDFNLHVGNSFNLEADTINLKSRGGGGTKIESATGGVDMHSNRELRLTTNTNMHQRVIGDMRVSTGGMLDLNGPPAAYAEKATPNNITTNRSVKESVAGRVPEHEPWGGHDESDTVVAAQAPSTTTPTTKDIDLADIQANSGTGSGSTTGPSPISRNVSQSSTNINPRSGNNWNAR